MRPQPGHAVTSGVNALRPRVCSSTSATAAPAGPTMLRTGPATAWLGDRVMRGTALQYFAPRVAEHEALLREQLADATASARADLVALLRKVDPQLAADGQRDLSDDGELQARLARLGITQHVTAGTLHAIALAQLRRRAADRGVAMPALLDRKVRVLARLVPTEGRGGREAGLAAAERFTDRTTRPRASPFT